MIHEKHPSVASFCEDWLTRLQITLRNLINSGQVTWGGWRQMGVQVGVEEGLSGDDPSAVAHLRQHWLHAPSLLPYNLSGSSFYLSSAKGDTWFFVHHYVTRLFAGKAKVVVISFCFAWLNEVVSVLARRCPPCC